MEIWNSSIIDNEVLQYGGGIHNFMGTLSLFNVTISGNRATGSEGGVGIYNGGGGVVNMQWTTITANSAGNGGGIWNASGTVNLRNSIVADNTTLDCKGLLTSGGYNLINQCPDTPRSVATDKRGLAARLEPLTVPGGDLWYLTSYHVPGPSSPALHAIPWGTTAADCGPVWAPDDQRLGHRTSPGCDMGAIQR
jgi:hypothetical protein